MSKLKTHVVSAVGPGDPRTVMSVKSAPSSRHPRRSCYRVLVVTGLLAALPGYVRASLLTPSVEAQINAHGAQSNAAHFSGPVILGTSGTQYSFAVWTDYGINRAGSSLAISTSCSLCSVAYGSATSIWTDALRISTPDVAAGLPIHFLFSVRLDGHLEGYTDPFTDASFDVQFNMFLQEHGSWVTQPSYVRYLGGTLSVDVSEILTGEFIVPNGYWFNLISSLSTRVQGGLQGPPGGMRAESSFGNSAEWLGGSVEVDGNSVPFTITSGSGHDYNSPAAVPEPGTILLLGSGLAGLSGVASRRKKKKESTSPDSIDH